MITDLGLGFRCDFFIGDAMTKPSKVLKDFLIHLLSKQRSAWITKKSQRKPSCQALKTYNAIKDKWIPITTTKEIESLFKQPQLDFSDQGKVLYLPPLEKRWSLCPNPVFILQVERNT